MEKIKKSTQTVLLALLVMLLWGSLFPCVKLGYKAFSIDTSYAPNLLLFAGIRFLFCGGIILAFCKVQKKSLKIKDRRNWVQIILVGLFAVILHYSCTYIGLTLTDSSKTAILKQLAVLVFIAFSFLFFKEDSFSWGKVIGAVLGFGGIVALNMDKMQFAFGIGEMLVVGASCCTVVSNVICKKVTQKVDAIVVTGYSQLFGGVLLCILGLSFGGCIKTISFESVGIFTYICIASIVGYCLWNTIVKNNNLSKLFIIKFTEPLFACVFGAILLGENIFKWQYLVAIVLVFISIVVSNIKWKNKEEKKN